MEHAAEPIPTLHSAVHDDDFAGWLVRLSLIEALVRPGLVVVLDELAQHLLLEGVAKTPVISSFTPRQPEGDC